MNIHDLQVAAPPASSRLRHEALAHLTCGVYTHFVHALTPYKDDALPSQRIRDSSEGYTTRMSAVPLPSCKAPRFLLR
jgi:hypothetical protein